MPPLMKIRSPEGPDEPFENVPETPQVPIENTYHRESRILLSNDQGMMQLYSFTEHIEIDLKTRLDKLVTNATLVD